MPRLALRTSDLPAAPAARPTLTPSEVKLFEALQPPGRHVPCITLAKILYGNAGPPSIANTKRMIANLKLVLKAQGAWTVVSRGWREELTYALAPAPAEAIQPAAKAMPARGSAPTPVPAGAMSPIAAAAEPIGDRRRRSTGTVTLPPCGYASWTYRENGDHAVRLPGEDRLRVLTPADQRFLKRTTESGAFEEAAASAEGE